MPRDRVLVVDDEIHFLEAVSAYLTSKGYDVIPCESLAAGESQWRTTAPDVVVLDHNLPDGNSLDLIVRMRPFDPTIPIVIVTAEASIDLAVQAVKLGAEQFLTKPLELTALLVVLQRCVENRRNRVRQLAEKNRQSRERVDPFLGRSPVIRRLAEVCAKVVSADSPVLIQGETGTGKGVLAHWFHENGPRAAEPFVDLNCGGLSRELLESELFGHEKGAFTGAVNSKPGLLEIAHKGTVFLDEIGDVDLQLQPRLLKVLEEKQFRRLGDVRDRRVDVRLIAATHQDIGKLIREKQFRSDLYFRINTIPLRVPPLRERQGHVPQLVEDFLRRFAGESRKHVRGITVGAMRLLVAYPWPGNVRELEHEVRRLVYVCPDGHAIDEAMLSPRVLSPRVEAEAHAEPDLPAEPASPLDLDRRVVELERRLIQEALERTHGNRTQAARLLGISRNGLAIKIERLRATRPSGTR